MSKALRGIFISGTDTDVGKTYVGAVVARHLVEQGLRVGVYKPVASGCVLAAGELVSEDAHALWQAAGQPGPLSAVCPQRFAAPLAPHLAARAEGQSIDRNLLQSGAAAWQGCCDVLLTEGAGGLLCPLDVDHYYIADLARELGFPLVIVARNALGTINHTLLTVQVARAYGLSIAGIVLSGRPPEAQDSSVADNRNELLARADVPWVTELAWGATEFVPAVDWTAVFQS